MIVILDNYDSFTYNLFQMLGELERDVLVLRSDQVSLKELADLPMSHLVISPGPGYPEDAGISVEAVRRFGHYLPVLGVCLGHQVIAAAFGAKIIRAATVVHGKVSAIVHQQQGILAGLPNPLPVGRYHSLIVDQATLPSALRVTARSENKEIMALEHGSFPIYGVQFHPESILSPLGKQILQNFVTINRQRGESYAG